MELPLENLFNKHTTLLKIHKYFEKLKIKDLIKEKFSGCNETTQSNLVEIMRKIGDYIESDAPEDKKEKLMDEINPKLVKIYEYENSLEF